MAELSTHAPSLLARRMEIRAQQQEFGVRVKEMFALQQEFGMAPAQLHAHYQKLGKQCVIYHTLDQQMCTHVSSLRDKCRELRMPSPSNEGRSFHHLDDYSAQSEEDISMQRTVVS